MNHPSRIALIALGAFVVAGLYRGSTAIAATACESLASLRLPNTTITIARPVAAGAFQPERPFTEPGPPPASYGRLPAFCRVAGTIKPTPDSDIKFEVWMPLTGWNGKFQAVGNGAWSGQIWLSGAGARRSLAATPPRAPTPATRAAAWTRASRSAIRKRSLISDIERSTR